MANKEAEVETSAPPQEPRRKRLGFRHVQTLLLFFVTFLSFTMRVNMSLAIVAMTNKANEFHFDWSLKIQSIVLSSFFWGYIVLMVPSGILAKKIGGKALVASSVFINAIISFLIPICGKIGGWQMVCACRITQGLAQSCVYPSLHQLICQWIPLKERGKLVTFIFAGAQLGIATQLSVSGLLATAWGWPAIFYTNGVAGTIWFITYMIFGAKSPERSKFISQTELVYIQNLMGRVGEQKKYPIPWRKIFRNVSFYAVLVAHCGYNWGFFTLMTEMPTYMAKVLKFKLSKNGLLSALPYVCSYLMSFVTGTMCDIILKHQWLSLTNIRKLFTAFAFWGPAFSLIGLGYVSKEYTTLAVFILIMSSLFNSAHYAGHLIIHSDMAPNFSSVLMGITSFVANIMSLIAPLVCGFIVQDEEDPKEWRKVFFLASAVYFCSSLVFMIFASAERQEWNEPKTK